jgi:hypothetical protein
VRQHADAPVIVAPDAGRIKVAERMAQHLGDKGADLAFIYKRRPKGTTNVAEAKEVLGDVDGRLCILTYDMIDSGVQRSRSSGFLAFMYAAWKDANTAAMAFCPAALSICFNTRFAAVRTFWLNVGRFVSLITPLLKGRGCRPA